MTPLNDLVSKTLIRMGDPNGTVWSRDEVIVHLQNAYQQMTTSQRVCWDWVYLENLPATFSYTAPWELPFLATMTNGFNAGLANITNEDERQLLGDERRRVGPANHTSPFEGTDGWLSVVQASSDIPATADVPKSLVAVDRVTWDKRSIDGMTPRLMQQVDARYEITKGEVYGFMWQKDGIRTLRKIRVPSAAASTVTVNGSWGVLRRVTDLTGTSVTGTWGLPRRIPGQHPIGSFVFGAPRRIFLDGKNVRVEHWRTGRPMQTTTDGACELPDRYALYLRDFAQWHLFDRKGPGQDPKLAAHFQQRWERDLTRVAQRIDHIKNQEAPILGGDSVGLSFRPPRPRLPWPYGARVR